MIECSNGFLFVMNVVQFLTGAATFSLLSDHKDLRVVLEADGTEICDDIYDEFLASSTEIPTFMILDRGEIWAETLLTVPMSTVTADGASSGMQEVISAMPSDHSDSIIITTSSGQETIPIPSTTVTMVPPSSCPCPTGLVSPNTLNAAPTLPLMSSSPSVSVPC